MDEMERKHLKNLGKETLNESVRTGATGLIRFIVTKLLTKSKVI
jgi:hypothetical protein